MLTTLKKIWNDEGGFVNSMELILIAVLAVIGLIVGLATFRDAVTQELADTGAAVGQINQSYSISVNSNGINPNNGPQILTVGGNTGLVTVQRNFRHDPLGPVIVSVTSTFRNSAYEDQPDVGDGQDMANMAPPGIITMAAPPTDEGN